MESPRRDRLARFSLASATLFASALAGCCFGGRPTPPPMPSSLAGQPPILLPPVPPVPVPAAPMPAAPVPAPMPVAIPTSVEASHASCALAARRSRMPPVHVPILIEVVRERAADLSTFCAGTEHGVGATAITSAVSSCARQLQATDLALTICDDEDCCGLTIHGGRGTPGADDDGDWVVVEGPADAMHPLSLLSLRADQRVIAFDNAVDAFDPMFNPNCTPAGIVEPPPDFDVTMPSSFTPVQWYEVGPGVRALVCQQPG